MSGSHSEDHDYDKLLRAARRDLQTPGMPDLNIAVGRLQALRDYSEFALLSDLAEEYLLHHPDKPEIKKLYGQALVDIGKPSVALGLLNSALQDDSLGDAERADIAGLVGRARKDLFLAALAQDRTEIAAFHLRKSYAAYHDTFRKSPADYHYQGINAAAVLDLAEEHGIEIAGAPVSVEICKEIIALLKYQDGENAWAHATLAEAHIALEDWDGVEQHLGEYRAHRKLSAFQVRGTLRQFRDVWRLQNRGQRGREVLAMLKAAALMVGRRSGGEQYLSVSGDDTGVPEEVSDKSLEKVLGADGLQTYEWLRTGLNRAKSVAAVLNSRRQRIGTSFVLEPGALGLEIPDGDELAMMTNYHVLNRKGAGRALSIADRPLVRFEAHENDGDQGKAFKISRILFESLHGAGGLDCTIFTIRADNLDIKPVPLELEDLPNLAGEHRPRVYLIGYPRGGEMQFSLQDNQLLDHEGAPEGTPPVPERRRVHYFAPTAPGNSGSPVFDEWWNCIALHHSGLKDDPEAGSLGMERLNGKGGHYSANEGIWIGSIAATVRGQAEKDTSHPDGESQEAGNESEDAAQS